MVQIDLIPSHDSMGLLAGYAMGEGGPLPFRNDEEVTNILRSKNTPERFIEQVLELVNENHIVAITDDGVSSIKMNLEVVGR